MPIRSFLGLCFLPGPKVFDSDTKGSTASFSSTQNVGLFPLTTLMVDEFDIEEMDLKWPVAMISTRLKKFYKNTTRKPSKENQESRRRYVGNTRYKARDNERRPAKQDEHKAMVTIYREGVDWTGHVKDDTEDYALMAFNSSNSGLDIKPVTAKNKANKTAGPKEANYSAGTQDNINARYSKMEAVHVQECCVVPLWSFYTSIVKSLKAKNGDQKLNKDTGSKPNKEPELGAARANSTNYVNTASTIVNTTSTVVNTASTPVNIDDGIFTSASYDDEGAMADFTNLESIVNVSPIPQYRIHSIHPTTQILRDPNSVVQTRSKVNTSSTTHAFVKQKEDRIFICQDKYVAEILKKFDFISVKTASTLIETKKPLVKDVETADVDTYLYRSMISSLMYLTASRPDIMYAVCACSRFQVTPKTSHLHAVKRIFRYLKGQPKLGLWYPKESVFNLEAYSDSDYARENLDMKSITGSCKFLGKRLISWQCKKQIIVATSTTEAEYVAVASCYGQVLWIQNQMLDYGFNFMNTKIYIDNEITIFIVNN
nr:uncharacterized mitochondrial protein AtMg00810-like [Tanacetum cinerariifolium]